MGFLPQRLPAQNWWLTAVCIRNVVGPQFTSGGVGWGAEVPGKLRTQPRRAEDERLAHFNDWYTLEESGEEEDMDSEEPEVDAAGTVSEWTQSTASSVVYDQ